MSTIFFILLVTACAYSLMYIYNGVNNAKRVPPSIYNLQPDVYYIIQNDEYNMLDKGVHLKFVRMIGEEHIFEYHGEGMPDPKQVVIKNELLSKCNIQILDFRKL